jgi:hypothetical protein
MPQEKDAMKKTAFLVTYGGRQPHGDAWDLKSIWSTRELAERERDRLIAAEGGNFSGYDVEEWTVDPTEADYHGPN